MVSSLLTPLTWIVTERSLISTHLAFRACPPERAAYPDLTVEEGIRIFLTGGTGMPDKMRATAGDSVD